jgi:acyl-CoA thioesterase-1
MKLFFMSVCLIAIWNFSFFSSAIADTEHKLVFFGDSITAGFGLNIDEAYPARIAEKIKTKGAHIIIVNAGSSGDTTAAGLRRLDWVLKQKPTWVVVALGGNDMLRGISVDQTEANLKSIIQKIKTASAQPLLFGMRATPNLGAEYTHKFDAIFGKVAKETRTPVLEFFIQPVAGHPEFTQADGLHPTIEGQKKIADFIWPFIEKQLRP